MAAAVPHIAVGMALLSLVLAPPQAGAETISSPDLSCSASARPMARVELIFGAKRKGGRVGPRDFRRFLAREVTPRFPAGLTIFEGFGQWRSASGEFHRETARMLLIWFEPDAKSDAKIEAIRSAYKKQFGQESVLRADAASCVSF
jgi:hypothetical protein